VAEYSNHYASHHSENRLLNMNINQYQRIFLSGLLALLSSCSSISLNPFGSNSAEQSRGPANATEYVCEGKGRFHVRMLNNGNDAWLIYPDHEVNLPKSGGDNRYSSGAITLVMNGAETTLNDGEKIAYTNCKPQEKVKQ
jgi:membrane-bound inhibitor of C-type lysozyme